MAEYIEREAAKAFFTPQPGIYYPGFKFTPSDVRVVLDHVPAADVREVVRGKWIKMKFFPDWECEKCGSVVGNTDDPWNYYHFCPNCGADMRIFSTNCKNTVITGENEDGELGMYIPNMKPEYFYDLCKEHGLEIIAIPAADVREVVMCRDCKYYGGKYADNECSLITSLTNPDYWLKTNSDDYCSSGERRGADLRQKEETDET